LNMLPPPESPSNSSKSPIDMNNPDPSKIG
jgi:hypothetical protein